MKTAAQIESLLQKATGTERWFAHRVTGEYVARYSDGAKIVFDECEAYWLLDTISAYETDAFRSRNKFQVWRLTRNKSKGSNGAVLVCEDGDGNQLTRQRISFTDFPLNAITFYFSDDTLYLPSEY